MSSRNIDISAARAGLALPARPFVLGDRVRCRISTRGSHRVEWRGCLGTVVRVKRCAGAESGPWWEVAVAYDGAPRALPVYHEAADLARACEL